MLKPRDDLHCLVYGDSGSKKSTFAATFPPPILVCFFDALGKDAPYLRAGEEVTGRIPGPPYPTQDVYAPDGSLLIRLEYFPDSRPRTPWPTSFQNRFALLQQHLHGMRHLEGEPPWKTIVFDSVTDLEIAMRKNSQYKLKPSVKEPRQWYADSTEQLEEILMIAVGSLPINVVTICHIDEDKDEANGQIVRNPMLPGKLRKKAAGAYAEFYRAGVRRGDKGEPIWYLQTQTDGQYNAGTQILAPDLCPPHYEALWTNVEK
jgi:hypothetical protein